MMKRYPIGCQRLKKASLVCGRSQEHASTPTFGFRPFGDSCIVELREPKTVRDGVAALACVQAVHGRNSCIRPGSDIMFGWRGAEGKKELYPQILTESVEQQVDVIFSGPVPAAVVAKQVTTTVPIVFIVVANPVTLGLLKNLEKRGGNTPASTKNGPISRASA